MLIRQNALLLTVLGAVMACGERAPTQPQPLAIVDRAEAQPLVVSVKRLTEALDFVGSPLPESTRTELDRALALEDEAELVAAVQRALDPHCLLGVHINPESRVSVTGGPAPRELVQSGWRVFLVKVHNEAGITSPLRVKSPEAAPLGGSHRSELRQRWLAVQFYNARPLTAKLTGMALDYRVLMLYSRDAGKRGAVLTVDAGQGTQDLGFRSDVMLFFDCAPSRVVTLRVRDTDEAPTTASFTIRDKAGREYPFRAKRLAPDFWFHDQVYRADGETVDLSPGTYTFEVQRGPEYIPEKREVTVAAEPLELAFDLERWVEPAAHGWWSGDHHIHAAGCKHYRKPTQGFDPADIVRHCAGEGLNVGCVLTWGSGMDHQSRFFTGEVDASSRPGTLLRYDIEVSGFGSHMSGHLCLLRLREQFYPGTDSWRGWPTLGLNILRWAKKQGAVCGAAHAGGGLWLKKPTVPDYRIPHFDGIGAMEYIVDITHEVPGPDGKNVPAVDFLGVCDTPVPSELNIWYHTLNCGYRPRVSGESDFPCIYGSRVGVGRSYVGLGGTLDFDAWCDGIARGRCYVSDGRTHLIDFEVDGVAVGTAGSELKLAQPGVVRVKAKVAALLAADPDSVPDAGGWLAKPYWNIERARIEGTRQVPLEVVVNGKPVAEKPLLADGTLRDVVFEVPIERSSWVTLRVLSSAHTNPVFVLVGDKPIRASRRSARWCLQSVDKCWDVKHKFFAPAEKEDAEKAFDHARRAYRRILAECEVN